MHDPPQPTQEARDPLDALLGPVHVLVGRPDEQDVQPHRIGAVHVGQLVGRGHVPARLRHLRPALPHPALVEQPRERLAEPDHPQLVQHLDEEARVEQVPGRVVDPAHVLVDRHPEVDQLPRERRLVILGVAVAQEVPGRVDEGVHRVGLSHTGAAARRAGDIQPLLVRGERRLALRPVVLDLGKQHRQLRVRHRHDPALAAVDDRDRRTPVALAREAPVTEPEADCRPAAPQRAEPVDDRTLRLLDRQPGELSRLDEHAALLVDHLPDRQPELLSELAVTLVVPWHGHDRAGPVLHQHVVGDPHRDLLAGRRVRRGQAGVDAGLLLGRGPHLAALCQRMLRVLAYLLAVRRALDHRVDQRMLGREHEEGRAEDRVGPRREDRGVLVQLRDPEQQLGALGAADPVPLNGDRPLGPVEQGVVLQQRVRVRRDPEEPLLHLPRLDDGPAALAAAVDHLLVRQHRLVVRTPVDRRLLAVGQPLLEETQEQPLRPAVVGRVVRGDHAIPVDRPTEPVHLALDVRDVALRDLARAPALADGRVLGR